MPDTEFIFFSILFYISFRFRYRILCSQFFSFSTLNMSSHCLLAYFFKLAINIIEDPLYMMSHFSQGVLKIFFVTFDCNVSQCGSLSFSYFEFIKFLECVDTYMSFLEFGSFQPSFLQIFFLPLWSFLFSFRHSHNMFVH